MRVEVTALDHIYMAVRDLEKSEAFYDPLMRFLDFRKGTSTVAGEPHVHYYNRVVHYTLRPARSEPVARMPGHFAVSLAEGSWIANSDGGSQRCR